MLCRGPRSLIEECAAWYSIKQLFVLPLQKEEVLSLVTLDVILKQGVTSLWGWSMGVPREGSLLHPCLSLPCT